MSLREVVLKASNTHLRIETKTIQSRTSLGFFLNKRVAPHTITRQLSTYQKPNGIIACITITYIK